MTTDQVERIRLLQERRAGAGAVLAAPTRTTRPGHPAERSRIAVAGAATALTLGLTGFMAATAGRPAAPVSAVVAAQATTPPQRVVIVVRPSGGASQPAIPAPASQAVVPRVQAQAEVAATPTPVQVTPRPVPITRTSASR